MNCRKKNDSEELKLDKHEQYDRRQNLELVGVPLTTNKDVIQITWI